MLNVRRSTVGLASHRFRVDQVRRGQGRSGLPAPVAGEDVQRGPDLSVSLVDLRGARGGIEGGDIMSWAIGGALVLFWLLVFVGQVGGPLIHLFLAITTVVFLVNFVMQHDPESTWA